jgi:hypothetical protein
MNKKNYFSALVAMFAMISVMILSSCSHDDYYYNEEKAEQALNDQYAIAFEKAFGKVGPNVDWGFGSKNSSTRAFTRSGVAFPTSITFPGDCDASNFLANWPEGTPKLPTWGGNAGLSKAFYIDEAYDMVQTHSGAAKLYVKGDIDLSAGDNNAQAPRFQVSTTSEIYLLEGATLKIGKASAENFIGAAVYIAEGATLETDYPLLLNSGIDVYNHGTINVKDLQVNTNSVLYNKGTVKATGTVSAESNPSNGEQSYIVNTGTIECADVVVNAGAVKNDFKWTVSGTTKINSNNSGWINTDHWKTGNYAYVAGSENVINSCFLEVTNDFDMNVSSLSATGAQAFKMNSGSSVVTTNFYGGRDLSDNVVKGGPFRINMAEYSLFKVTNKATLESGRGPILEGEVGFGFFGPSEGGYAVFQAKDIVRDSYLASINSHGAVTYGGNLYVSAETHFAQGYDSDGSGSVAGKPFIYEQGSFSIANNIYAAGSGFKPGKPSITIAKTDCCPGFQGGDPLYRVIAEDLSATEAGDFDFNDVVFDVVGAEGGKTTLKLIAAGGIYKLTVGGKEVHELFGEDPKADGTYPMINTGAGATHDPVEFKVDGTYTTPEQIRNIQIIVYKPSFENGIELTATTGKAACKILVDDTFTVAKERENIADDNQNFYKYVQGTWDSEEYGFWWQKKN